MTIGVESQSISSSIGDWFSVSHEYWSCDCFILFDDRFITYTYGGGVCERIRRARTKGTELTDLSAQVVEQQ